jgi:hypothetical protein
MFAADVCFEFEGAENSHPLSNDYCRISLIWRPLAVCTCVEVSRCSPKIGVRESIAQQTFAEAWLTAPVHEAVPVDLSALVLALQVVVVHSYLFETDGADNVGVWKFDLASKAHTVSGGSRSSSRPESHPAP